MIDLINYKLKDEFYNLVNDTKKQIRLCAPYVKESIINNIYKNKKENVDVEIISSFNMANFYKRSSDIEAFKLVLDNDGKVYNFQSLHAKIYIFDDKYTVITSSNLTPSGFGKNFEYGVLIEENSLVNKTIDDYKSISDNVNTGKINHKNIKEIQEVLESLPKYKETSIGKYLNHNEVDNILSVDKELFQSKLSPWQRLTVDVIGLINKEEFNLSQIYEHEEVFINKYPKNNTIRDSIRRNLQELRDLGLVKFLGNGMYNKLWK